MKNADKIELIPVGQPVGPLKWQMSLNGGAPQGSGKYPDVVVKYGDMDDITFTIRHPGSIRFAQQDAFCAQLGKAKPQTCDTIDFSFTGGGTTQLVVTDKNGTAGDYTYVLNFNDGTPQLDPIIKNGGGGTGIASNMNFTTANLVEIGGAIILVALVAYVARRMFMTAPRDTTKGP
jgi:hypothetical protein